MAEIDNQTLMKRTLVTVAAMVGACVALVGTLTLVAALAVGHAVAPTGEEEKGSSPVAAVPMANIHGMANPATKVVPAPPPAK